MKIYCLGRAFLIISDSLVENYLDRYFDTIYVKPTFYDANSLKTLFKQALFNFFQSIS